MTVRISMASDVSKPSTFKFVLGTVEKSFPIIVGLNVNTFSQCSWSWGDEKGSNLCQLFKLTTTLDIILIQESMYGEAQAIKILFKFLPGCKFYAICSTGILGGHITCWNPRVS